MTSTKIVKLEPKALALKEPLEIAEAQLATLVRVLEPHRAWLDTKPGKMELERRPEAEKTLVAVRELRDTAEKGRVQLTKPLLDQKKEIDGLYKDFATVAGSIDAHLWQLIQAARVEETAIAQKAAEKVAKAAEKKGAVQFAADVREQAATAPALEVLSEQEMLEIEVVDLKALVAAVSMNALPLNVVQPNLVAIRQLVKGGMRPAGVRVTKTTIARRGR